MSQTDVQKYAPRLALVGLAALLVLGLGAAVYNGGWSQGYLMGMLTGGAERGHMTPYLAPHAGYYGGWHGGFGFVGGLFRLVFLVFLAGIFFKFLGFMHWRMHGGQEPWGPHGRGPWTQHGPWGQPGQPQPHAQPEPGRGQPQPGQEPGQPGPSAPQPTGWTQV